MNREACRDLAIALSLANVLFLRAWGALLNPANHYLLGAPPSATATGVTIAGVLLLAAILFGLARASRRHAATGLRRNLTSLAMLAAFLIALNLLRQQVPALAVDRLVSSAGSVRGLVGLVLVIVALTGAAVQRWGLERLARAAVWVVLVATPFAVMTMGQALWLASRPQLSRATFQDQTPLPLRSGHELPARLVFLVFDGLDQQLLETDRTTGLHLPAFDRLFEQAIRWDNAYPPSQSTLVSMPSLITGRALHAVRATAANELALRFAGTDTEAPWSEVPSLFTRANALGGHSALIGWYHPYCRVIGRTLNYCRWYPYSPELEHPLRNTIRAQGVLMLDSFPGAFRLRGGASQAWSWPSGQTDARWHARLYRAIHAETLRAIADPRLDLIFVHYPIPHEPGIFDRRSGTLTTNGATYVDNLALTDRALAELDRALGDGGLAPRTALLVTADHAHRRGGDRKMAFPVVGRLEHRVPLILRLPGQVEPVVRHEIIRNVVAHDLALAVLGGTLRAPADLDRALAGNGNSGIGVSVRPRAQP